MDAPTFDPQLIPDEGYIRDYVDWASQATDAPLPFLFAGALATLAAAAGRRLRISFGAGHVYPNLFAVILAPSSTFRKSTAVALARQVLEAACPDTIMPDRITPESFYEMLAETPSGLFTLAEMGGFLANLEKRYALGLKQDLSELFDCPEKFRRIRKNKAGRVVEFTIEAPAISIIGASVVRWFVDRLNEGDVLGGFLPRFLLVPATKRDREPFILPPQVGPPPDTLVRSLRELSLRDPITLRFDKTAPGFVHYADFYHETEEILQSKDDQTIYAPFFTRLHTYALKLSMLAEASFDPTFTCEYPSAQSVAWAVAWARWFRAAVDWVLEHGLPLSAFDEIKHKVLRAIASAGGKIEHSRLLRNIGLSARQLKEVIETLAEEGRILIATASGRRKATRLYVLTDPVRQVARQRGRTG